MAGQAPVTDVEVARSTARFHEAVEELDDAVSAAAHG
jgi:hypothetical protein